MSYTMEFAESVDPLDEVIEDKGVKVLIDPKAVLFLLGSEMDFKTDRLSATSQFRNPNETSACGCGEAFDHAGSEEALRRPERGRRRHQGPLRTVRPRHGQAHVRRRRRLRGRALLRHRIPTASSI